MHFCGDNTSRGQRKAGVAPRKQAHKVFDPSASKTEKGVRNDLKERYLRTKLQVRTDYFASAFVVKGKVGLTS